MNYTDLHTYFCQSFNSEGYRKITPPGECGTCEAFFAGQTWNFIHENFPEGDKRDEVIQIHFPYMKGRL